MAVRPAVLASDAMQTSYRLLVADDHPLMRSALCQAVAQAVPAGEIAEAGSLEAVVEAIEGSPPDRQPDLVLLDLKMPGMNDFAGLLLLRSSFPAVPVVIVSASEDARTVRRALDYGASGFVPKSAPAGEIGAAVRTVLEGGVWLPPAMPDGAAAGADEQDFARRVASLTPHQLRVLSMIAEGKLNKQIAWELGVGEATVKSHVTFILRKLGVVTRTQAVIAARRLLVDGDGSAS
jgi:DNA-binding NarL/FixJ family response regulator